MSTLMFLFFAALIIGGLFVLVKTFQSVTRIAASMALIGFVLMVGMIVAFTIGLGDDTRLGTIKTTVTSAVAGSVPAPIGKAIGFFKTTRNTIEETKEIIRAQFPGNATTTGTNSSE